MVRKRREQILKEGRKVRRKVEKTESWKGQVGKRKICENLSNANGEGVATDRDPCFMPNVRCPVSELTNIKISEHRNENF